MKYPERPHSKLQRITLLAVFFCSMQYPVMAHCGSDRLPGLWGRQSESRFAAFFDTTNAGDTAAAQQSGIAVALRDVKRGTLLRVGLRDGGVIEGPFARVDGNTCVFGDANNTEVDISGIDRAWKRSSWSSKGMLIGAILASTVTTLYLVDRGAYVPEYLIGIAAASVGGGLAGAGIGSVFHDWKEITLPHGAGSSSPWSGSRMQRETLRAYGVRLP